MARQTLFFIMAYGKKLVYARDDLTTFTGKGTSAILTNQNPRTTCECNIRFTKDGNSGSSSDSNSSAFLAASNLASMEIDPPLPQHIISVGFLGDHLRKKWVNTMKVCYTMGENTGLKLLCLMLAHIYKPLHSLAFWCYLSVHKKSYLLEM